MFPTIKKPAKAGEGCGGVTRTTQQEFRTGRGTVWGGHYRKRGTRACPNSKAQKNPHLAGQVILQSMRRDL